MTSYFTHGKASLFNFVTADYSLLIVPTTQATPSQSPFHAPLFSASPLNISAPRGPEAGLLFYPLPTLPGELIHSHDFCYHLYASACQLSTSSSGLFLRSQTISNHLTLANSTQMSRGTA